MRKMKLLSSGALCVPVGLASMLISTAAVAQTPVAAAPAGVEEVIVTTRRQSENLQTVPLTITALSGDQLKNAGTQNLRDVSFLTPGLVINPASGETGNAPVMRGLVSLGGTTEPTVATFFDGAYIGNASANTVAQLDLARIEVVKGPVNSLYGRAAYAGAINYISKVPTNAYDFRASATVGNNGQRRLSGVVGGPIIRDILKVRVAAGYDGYDGGYEDSVNKLRAGGFEKKDGQISVAFTPTERINILGRVYYGKDVFEDGAIGYVDNNCGGTTNYAGVLRRTFYCGQYNPDQHAVEVAPEATRVYANDRKVTNAYLRATYSFDGFDVSSLTTSTNVEQARFTDFNGKRNGIPFVLTPGPGVINLFQSFGSQSNNDDFSQEIRVSAHQDKRIRWNAGGYYTQGHSYDSTITGLDSTKLPAGQTITGGPATSGFLFDRVFLAPAGTISRAVTAAKSRSKLQSVFLGADVDVIPKLVATGEIRYTRDTRYQDNLYTNTAVGVFRPVGPPRTKTFPYYTGRASVKYTISPGNMVYATYANGVKAGGFNLRATLVSEIPYDPETNKTYEIGTKTGFLDNRLQVNVSAFYVTLEGLQYLGPSSDPLAIGTITKNIGAAKSKGVELDFKAAPMRGLSVTGGGSFTKSELASGSYDFSAFTTCAGSGPDFCDQSRIVQVPTASGNRTALKLEGLQVPRQPKFTAFVSARYEHDLAAEWKGFVQGEYRYQSKQYVDVTNTWWWGALNRVNLRAGVTKNNVTLTGYVNNLTDDNTPDQAVRQSQLNDFSFIYNAYMPYPREYGMTVDVKF